MLPFLVRLYSLIREIANWRKIGKPDPTRRTFVGTSSEFKEMFDKNLKELNKDPTQVLYNL